MGSTKGAVVSFCSIMVLFLLHLRERIERFVTGGITIPLMNEAVIGDLDAGYGNSSSVKWANHPPVMDAVFL